ncbi:unnamed protein product [Calypogeia fissa]
MIGGSTQAQQKASVTLTRLCCQFSVQGLQRTRLCTQCSARVMEPACGSVGDSVLLSAGLDVEHSLKNMLVELRNGGGPGDGRIVFPPTLTARQRRRAHETAERLGLGHISLGQGSSRYLTAWRMSVAERLSRFHKLLDVEEAASRANFMIEQPVQSWRILEAQGILLYNATVAEKEAASFGRERWVLEDGVGVERVGHVARFSQRARPGMPICIAEKDSTGGWVPAKEQPPGRVAWSRGKKICFVFDHSPSLSEQINCFLLVPDSSSFERMHSVIRELERGEKYAGKLLDALLGSAINDAAKSIPVSTKTRGVVNSRTSSDDEVKEEHTGQFFDKGLNVEQHAAVTLCTEPVNSPVVLIHGPFGTGKTRTLVEVIRQQVKAGRRVLVCAASNTAVDNMVQALLTGDSMLPLARAGLTERVSSSVAAYTLEALQDAQPEAAIARRLRKEAYSMQLAAEKWTRAASGGEKRRNARKEVNALFKDARRLDKMCITSVLQRTKVLCGTLTGFASALREIGDSEEARFDCVVVDEASQAITPALLLVLPYLNDLDGHGSERVPVFVMAGDHQQLPPTVLSEDVDDTGGGLKATLFEELMERDGGGLGTRIDSFVTNDELWESAKLSILHKAHALASGMVEKSQQADPQERSITSQISVALRQQYRMPVQLMAFPSAAFYGGKLIARKVVVGILETADEASIVQVGPQLEVIDMAGAGCEEEKTGEAQSSSTRLQNAVEVLSTSNPGQAELTVRVVQEILKTGTYLVTDIGVVTPYSAQVMLLRQLMVDEVEAGLEIDSVDAYQGREKEVIVLDAVRSNTEGTIGFLSDFHRLNVSITRARQKLIVIGDSATLSIDPVWAVFFEWVSDYRENPVSGISYRSFFELPSEGGW